MTPFSKHLDVFVSYNLSHKGYKYLNQPSRTFVSRHVIFDESIFPYASISTLTNHSQPKLRVTQTYFLIIQKPLPKSTSNNHILMYNQFAPFETLTIETNVFTPYNHYNSNNQVPFSSLRNPDFDGDFILPIVQPYFSHKSVLS